MTFVIRHRRAPRSAVWANENTTQCLRAPQTELRIRQIPSENIYHYSLSAGPADRTCSSECEGDPRKSLGSEVISLSALGDQLSRPRRISSSPPSRQTREIIRQGLFACAPGNMYSSKDSSFEDEQPSNTIGEIEDEAWKSGSVVIV